MMDKKATTKNPFKEFEWMGDMDNFDRQVEEELLEEDFIRTCIEQLLDEEEERETMTAAQIIAQNQMQNLHLNGSTHQPNQRPVRNGETATYMNGYGSHNDHNNIVLVSSRIESSNGSFTTQLGHFRSFQIGCPTVNSVVSEFLFSGVKTRATLLFPNLAIKQNAKTIVPLWSLPMLNAWDGLGGLQFVFWPISLTEKRA